MQKISKWALKKIEYIVFMIIFCTFDLHLELENLNLMNKKASQMI
jgi:hypothetical protein